MFTAPCFGRLVPMHSVELRRLPARFMRTLVEGAHTNVRFDCADPPRLRLEGPFPEKRTDL